jgi:hypothetical protein
MNVASKKRPLSETSNKKNKNLALPVAPAKRLTVVDVKRLFEAILIFHLHHLLTNMAKGNL